MYHKHDVNEQVIKGNIAIIKHTDNGETQIETPEEGAVFEVFWIVNSKLNNFFKVILPVLNWCQVTERGMKSVIVKPIHIISKLQF